MFYNHETHIKYTKHMREEKIQYKRICSFFYDVVIFQLLAS